MEVHPVTVEAHPFEFLRCNIPVWKTRKGNDLFPKLGTRSVEVMCDETFNTWWLHCFNFSS
jgi:hypothetical protein